jgi:hypothetical protein
MSEKITYQTDSSSLGNIMYTKAVTVHRQDSALNVMKEQNVRYEVLHIVFSIYVF